MRSDHTEAVNRTTALTDPSVSAKRLAWVGWIPLLVLPVATMTLRSRLQPWYLMWVLAFAIFFGCKWQTWWELRKIARGDFFRTVGYFFAWPGMDAETFLNSEGYALRPELKEWIWACFKTAGRALLWGVVRRIPEGNGLLVGWVGMLGISLM